MKVEILTPTMERKYQEYILTLPESLFSSSLLFRDFIHKMIPQAIPFYLIATEKDSIYGVLPAFVLKGKYGAVLNSMPWFGSNPGVLTEDFNALTLLLEAFRKTAQWTGCVSSTIISSPFTEMSDLTDYYEVYHEDGIDEGMNLFFEDRTFMITFLPEYGDDFEDRLMGMIDSKTRNEVRKARKNVEVIDCFNMTEDERGHCWEYLKNTHQKNMQLIGASFKDKEFDIFQTWELGKDINLFIPATVGDYKPAGALLLKYFNKTVDYLVPAVDINFRHLCPMHECIFYAMKDAAKRGFKFWNWGGTIPDKMPGVYHFKRNFGATEGRYRYYTEVFDKAILNHTKEELQKEYPFFYVVPYNHLKGDKQ